ncbi:MAG: CDP-glycerol glycerophosphotransferase family protein [Microbacterium sp.]|uniref:CDP-glycerol glycerophosphotransferase family protein n=1 Tax=Microbacterium sp. TaxID=51671 RepID=UPI0039E5053C
MIDKLIEGRLLTVIVGSVFRLVEVFVRAIHLGVRGLAALVQNALTSPIDAWMSVFGKRMVARRVAVDGSSIVIIEQDGEYAGDPKYVAEELLRRAAPYRITWVLRPQSVGPYPREFHFVRYGTADYVRAVAAAKVVVHSGRCLQQSGVVNRSGQHWLHTGPGLTLGHPRNDILFHTSPEAAGELRKKALDRLGIADTGQRLALFTPARGDGARGAPLSGIDFIRLRAALSERFGGTWDILIRVHGSGTAPSDLSLAGLPAYCHNASSYPDVQELLVLADAGIADRSRWLCDYLLTGKPAFVFCAQRDQARGCDEHLPLATSNDELLAQIAGFDPEAHRHRIEQFLKARGSGDDGSAARRVVDRIEELMAR